MRAEEGLGQAAVRSFSWREVRGEAGARFSFAVDEMEGFVG